MKNIHVLPTENESRLRYNSFNKVYELCEFPKYHTDIKSTHNIYITSDERIERGDWVFDAENEEHIYRASDVDLSNIRSLKSWYCKKIILTTDVDLIKYGVQAIDDEFLEWFVKNPNCEGVEVEKISVMNDRFKLGYKIIIPKEEVISDYDVMSNIVYGKNVGERIKIKAKIISKEEPKPFKNMLQVTKADWEKFKKNPIPNKKQETLEEAVQKVANSDDFINGALFGSLWQQEQIGKSEFLQKLRATLSDAEARRLIFEQFKNK